MIIDIHGHYTTEPAALHAFRDKQLAGLADPPRKPATTDLGISDELLVQSVQPQLDFQKERGTDLTLFSPRAAGMAHHVGREATSLEWTALCNDIIYRICALLPDNFAAVGQLPQSPGAPPEHCIPELERIVNELGFVGVNLNPDPSGGMWTGPPLTDRQWYPLYEKLCELDVPAMIHVSSSCNSNFHGTGAPEDARVDPVDVHDEDGLLRDDHVDGVVRRAVPAHAKHSQDAGSERERLDARARRHHANEPYVESFCGLPFRRVSLAWGQSS